MSDINEDLSSSPPVNDNKSVNTSNFEEREHPIDLETMEIKTSESDESPKQLASLSENQHSPVLQIDTDIDVVEKPSPQVVISSSKTTLTPTPSHAVNVAGEVPVEGQPSLSFEDSASWISRAFVTYLDPLFLKGYQNPLNHEDLGVVSKQDKSSLIYASFTKQWEIELKQPAEKRSLWRVLFRTIGYWRISYGLGLYAAYSAVSFGPILILNALTKHLQGTEVLDPPALWIFVSLMFVLPMAGSLFASMSNNIMAHIGVQFRNALITMIYIKSLKLSPASRQSASTGQIVTMFSSDTAQIQRFLFFVNNIALAPPTIAVALALIYQQVGPATFVGLAVMVVLMPLSGFIFGLINSLRTLKVKVTDRRVKLMNEILSGIRIIKFYAWEAAFEGKINAIREEELVLLKKIAYVIALGFSIVLASTPIIQPVVIFLTYSKLGNQLDAAKAFTTISLFNLLQLPFTFLPLGLAQYSQSLVSSKRMLQFFIAEELEPYVIKTSEDETDSDTVIEMAEASLGWMKPEATTLDITSEASHVHTKAETSSKQKEYEMVPTNDTSRTGGVVEAETAGPVNRSVYTLTGLNVNIKKGQLVAVVGSVGSGKSSLLSALLGELNLQKGKVKVLGSIAYCDQRPWIINATVQENILFGLPYDEDRFDLAVHATNLEDDIHMLPGGVLTEIGEKGINLSGGQKARVALARAVYRNADVYLLDDPLSAVDAHVGQHLFEECFRECLSGSTRVLVTHHVHVLPFCDSVIVLQEGRIIAQGTYQQILETGLDFEALVPPKQGSTETTVVAEKRIPQTLSSSQLPVLATNASSSSLKAPNSPDSSNSRFEIVRYKSSKSLGDINRRKTDVRSSSVISTEERNLGDVASEAYLYYIKTGGVFLFSLTIFMSIVNQVLVIVSSFWLSFWGQVSVREAAKGTPLTSDENLNYLNYFALFSLLALAVFIIRSLLLAEHRLGTSVQLHRLCVKHVLGATVAFFDITPLGRILNRFSSDMATVDEELSQSISQVMNSMFSCIGSIGAMAGATKGTFLVIFVPMIVLYERAQRYFRKTNTTVARLESISRSPIYADFNQALTGLNTIRAYGDEQRFINTLENRVDRNTIAAVTQQIAGQWLAVRLDFLGSVITFFIALLAISSGGFIPAGFMALGLSYSFQLTQFLKFCVRMLASLEAQFNSVERIMHYTSSIEQDGGIHEDASLVPADWPTKGEIKGQGLQMRYRDGPLVLTGLDFEIAGSEKIGVAGRTGSGKSSLMNALFRIQELAAGVCYIDGIDISFIPLHTLRSKLGIIPQDPVMFSASVRFNLDPFTEKTDEEIWTILDRVAMKEHILSLPGKLDEVVAEGGDNFSAGQRQLICIARALLRKPKILILDEATASIDNETDALIQSMVRKAFKQSTVLTIAHRLHTIIDCDRIMVLDAGKLAEMDSAENLMKKEDGIFKALWERHQSSHGGAGGSGSLSATVSAENFDTLE